MRALLLLFILLITNQLFAQNGVLKGHVTANNEPLSYASVSIKGLGKGVSTNTKGYFEIKNIPPGTYGITFTSIGYEADTVSITINNNEPVIKNVSLKEKPSKLNEVVVTGVSRATQLRSNPVPITVMSKKEIEQHVNNNIIDAIIKGVPGVSAVTTGPNISKPFIRGLGYNRVLTLYDGIRQEGQQWGDEHGIEIDQYGIGRAEVVKGPASLTYGSDALAGVINLIPYIPSGDDGKLNGDFITDYHTNNGMIGTSVGLSYKQNNWKYAFRATAKAAHDYQNKIDGFVYNTGFREFNLSGIARVDKSWGYSQIGATLYDNRQEIPDGSRDSLSRRFTKQIYEAGQDDIKNRPVVSNDELRSYAITPLHQRIQHYRVYNTNSFKTGDGSINTSLGFQQSIRREYDHPTIPEQAGLYVVLNTVNYDVRYNLPSLGGVETTAGINGMYQTNRSKAATDFPIPDYNLFDAGGFLFAKRSFGRIDISGGLRYDTRHITWNNFYVGTDAQTGFGKQVHLPDTAGASLQFPAFKHNYRGFSGSLGLTYNISDRLLLKANIARGYRAPNITEIGSNGLDPGAHIVYLGNRSFNPEFSLQEDLGFIAYLPDMDIIAEVFNNNINNYIYQAKLNDANGNPVIIVPGNSTYQYQQSKARLYGAELTLNLHPQSIKWLAFDNSISYVTGINKNQPLIDKYGEAAKYLPFIPPLHTRSALRATLPGTYGVFNKLNARIEADGYTNQNHFYALDNTETFTKGYTLFNAGLGFTIKAEKAKSSFYEFFIQGDNLFDTAYQANLNRLKYFEYYKSSPNGHTGIYNMGRNISFKVILHF
ncbi:iron complex outermembrane recepter protein [Mucilaginibacter lappiensis]|uniref:Iron complex outermembrane receptor protein n=1 Tax=Mucilaginibacter lappiensis TaxID=354630 RepID=A0ABR6PKN1_9SPHI|nr:TonB-dependent receptor [Mucilaginibacter lappiensis]MBB6110330.1 iron complex outermembrane receptor protein [Mucilaginibacter lappiensis]SIR30581.1 iron complex outermembrane recepter protein [Mucilaginibacter lappiensis]